MGNRPNFHLAASLNALTRLAPAGSVNAKDGKDATNAGKKAGEPKPGDTVAWDSSGGHSVGKVVKKVTAPTKIKSHKVAASPENPQFIVKSDKTGKQAAHKASALKKP